VRPNAPHAFDLDEEVRKMIIAEELLKETT